MAPRRNRNARGLSLVEAMVSMAVFSIGALGVAQLQVVASAQAGMARRSARAVALASDVAEEIARWERTDPRLATVPGCWAGGGNFPPTDANLGSAKVPGAQQDFTAAASTDPDASGEGATTDGLALAGTSYGGAALQDFAALRKAGFQLMWSVRAVNTLAAQPGQCQALMVSVVVRYPGLGSTYRNVVQVVMKSAPSGLDSAALAGAL